jgi:hypothetical protein
VRKSLEIKRLKIAPFFFLPREREEDIVALFREMGMGLDGRKRADWRRVWDGQKAKREKKKSFSVKDFQRAAAWT